MRRISDSYREVKVWQRCDVLVRERGIVSMWMIFKEFWISFTNYTRMHVGFISGHAVYGSEQNDAQHSQSDDT